MIFKICVLYFAFARLGKKQLVEFLKKVAMEKIYIFTHSVACTQHIPCVDDLLNIPIPRQFVGTAYP